MQGNEINFVHKDISERDKDLFFGPDTEEEFVIFDSSWTFVDIILSTNKISSKSQARKNGWTGEIPKGFTELTVGKGRKRLDIFILNTWDHNDD